MTRDEAIRAEVLRVAAAAAAGRPHLVHIRVLAHHRLRATAATPGFDTTYDDERAGDRMFGDGHQIRALEPVAA